MYSYNHILYNVFIKVAGTTGYGALMLFGRGKQKDSEDVLVIHLVPLLNELFDRKLGSLEAKAHSIVVGIRASRDAFLEACSAFEASEAEPDREGLRNVSQTFINEQKKAYINALRRILSAEAAGESDNIYNRYESELANIEYAKNEILKVNARFRLVLESYSNGLDMFRASFSSMERYAKALKAELTLRSREVGEYREILESIQKLVAFREELEEIRKASADIGGSANEARSSKEQEMSQVRMKISELGERLTAANKGISDIKSRISLTMAPLAKATKKYEHGMQSKKVLSYYIENPVDTLFRATEEYGQFYKNVLSLKKEMESGKVDVKNRQQAIAAADFILSGTLSALIEEIGVLESSRKPIVDEMAELERISRDISRAERGEAERIRSASDIIKEEENIRKAQKMLKGQIESLFERYYKRLIKIDIDHSA